MGSLRCLCIELSTFKDENWIIKTLVQKIMGVLQKFVHPEYMKGLKSHKRSKTRTIKNKKTKKRESNYNTCDSSGNKKLTIGEVRRHLWEKFFENNK